MASSGLATLSNRLLAELVGDHEDAAGEQRQSANHGAWIDFRSGAATGAAASRLRVSQTRRSPDDQRQTGQFDRLDRNAIDELVHDLETFLAVKQKER